MVLEGLGAARSLPKRCVLGPDPGPSSASGGEVALDRAAVEESSGDSVDVAGLNESADLLRGDTEEGGCFVRADQVRASVHVQIMFVRELNLKFSSVNVTANSDESPVRQRLGLQVLRLA